jgi:F5/8 type C domain
MEILGVGGASLLGGDLTDPEDDGDETLGETDPSWNWKSITADDEPAFNTGEAAFNVFDNKLGPGDDKWCCTDATVDSPRNITVEFFDPIRLTHFTMSSANDVPARDPQDWQIQGSNDGITFTPIFIQEGDESQWTTVRFQVNKYTLDVPSAPYTFIRYECTRTADPLHQIGEIEYFGLLGPGVPVITLLGQGTASLIGGDLTDPDNNGSEVGGPTDPSWNWESITSNNEAFFDGAEGSFNIFDNQVGGGTAKWCCDDPTPATPHRVDVKFLNPVVLKFFTITSGNDARDREPLTWGIYGSNDGVTYTPIFTRDSPTSIWTDINQVARVDLPLPAPPPYLYLRYEVSNTAGALYQLNEIEYFGDSGGTSKPTLSGRKAEGTTVTFDITDGADTALNGASVVVKLDGAVAATVMSKVGTVTTFTHTPSPPFVPHSVHPYEITGLDNFGNALRYTGDVTQAGVSNFVGGGKWTTEHVWTNSSPQIGSVVIAEEVLNDPVSIGAESITTETTYIHFNDNSAPAWFIPLAQPYPLWDPVNGGAGLGDRQDFAIRCRGQINVIQPGMCWFICNSDDGFALRIDGTEIGTVGDRGRGDTVMSADLTAGPHEVEFVHYERGGGAGVSVYAYKGTLDTQPQSLESKYELLQAWLNPSDSDGDGMLDTYETANGLNPALNDAAGDLDGDTVTNLVESQRGTRANDVDTDDDGLNDNVETGTGVFVNAGNTGTNPLVKDTDGDSLDDAAETNTGTFVSATNAGTNPFVRDTDGDSVVDGAEVTLGTNPTSAAGPISVIQGGGTWTTEHVWTRTTAMSQALAEAVLDDPSAFPPEDSTTVETTFIHFHDDVAPPWFVAQSKPYPLWDPVNGGTGFGARDNFAIRSRGQINITQPGTVWFDVNSDDGFFLRIDGTEIGSVGDRGRADSVLSAVLTAGIHDVEVIHWEVGGGAGVSVLVYRVVTDVQPLVSGDTWQLLEAFAPSSPGKITKVEVTSTNVVVTFTPTNPAGTYRAASSTTLATWAVLPNVPVVSGADLVFTLPRGADPAAFYRVVQQ